MIGINYMLNFMIDDFENVTPNCDYYEYGVNSNSTMYMVSVKDYEFSYSNSNNFITSNYSNNSNSNSNNFIDVLIVFFVTSSSLLFSILIVSVCVYEKMINEFVEKYNAHKECYEYDTYFFEYLDEFNELNNIKLVDENLNLLEHKYIKQKTPKGEVLMNYNHSNSSFDYYCKKSNSIDFLYLDVVARIYVVKYNCKNIFIDNYDNFELIKSYYANLTNAISTFDEMKENNIFYNKVNTKNKAKQPIEYVSNKYKYRGTFEDFNSYCKTNNYKVQDLHDLLENDIFTLKKNIEKKDACTEVIQEVEKDTTNIDFKTFKNMIATSSNN